MPTSNITTVPIVIKTIQRLNPNSILDFGIGFGKYGFLLREYLDVPKLAKGFSGNLCDNFSVRIDGIEADLRYVGGLQKSIYNKIYIGNGSELVEKTDCYDVVLLLDVIEHFTKEDGHNLLKKLYMKTLKTLVVTTPFFDYSQGDIYGNEYERHRSVWNMVDFDGYKNKQFRIIDGQATLLILLHKDNQCNIEIPTAREHWSGRYLINEAKGMLFEALSRLPKKVLQK